MEESEKRRERLKAMRMEAAQVRLHDDTGNAMGVPDNLTNPLIESSAIASMPTNSHSSSRFDFYTDPMAAFSANKRWSKVSQQNTADYLESTRPRNPDLSHASVGRVQTNSSQDGRMFQARGSCSGPFGSPIQNPNPYGAPQGNNSNFWGGPSGTPTYHYPSHLPRAFNAPSPGFRPKGTPSFSSGQDREYGFNNSLQVGSGYKGSPYSNPERDNSPRTGLGNRGTPYPTPAGGRNAGRGRGSQNFVSAEQRPDRYYHRSMVEDPWKMLKPGIWQRKSSPTSLRAPDSDKSWLPKSLYSKKARVSEALDKYRSKQSLAEYLAASLNEAVHEPEDDNFQDNV